MTEFTGLYEAPAKKHEHDGAEFPKWVKVHRSHVKIDSNGVIAVPAFSEHHVDRVSGDVSVLVVDDVDEERALSGAGESEEKKGKAK